jgi:hypothetical protein
MRPIMGLLVLMAAVSSSSSGWAQTVASRADASTPTLALFKAPSAPWMDPSLASEAFVYDGPGLDLSRPLIQNRFTSPNSQAWDARDWPSALKWTTAGYTLDISPHAGVNFRGGAQDAEAGALVRFGSDLGARFAKSLGLHEVTSDVYGDRGRWYLFAGASGKTVGLNVTPGAAGLPRNSWSAESTSTLISDAQAGLGWRKGDLQASFGYVHREIKGQTFDLTGPAPAKISDSMLAFSLSFHPH